MRDQSTAPSYRLVSFSDVTGTVFLPRRKRLVNNRAPFNIHRVKWDWGHWDLRGQALHKQSAFLKDTSWLVSPWDFPPTSPPNETFMIMIPPSAGKTHSKSLLIKAFSHPTPQGFGRFRHKNASFNMREWLLSWLKETNLDRTAFSHVKVQRFVDPSNHPDLFLLQTLWL